MVFLPCQRSTRRRDHPGWPLSVPPLAGAMVKYSKASESATSCKARGCDLRVHFKVCRVGRTRSLPTPR